MSRLNGWQVLVPRPEGRGSPLISLLDAEGASAQAIPMITIAPPTDSAALDTAAMSLAAGDYQWVGFTSVNAISAIVGRARALALSPVIPADTRIAAVGQATATALHAGGFAVDVTPEKGGSAAGLAAIWPAPSSAESVLLPQSAIASPVLADRLRDKGFDVDVVTAYRTFPAPPPASVAADLTSGAFDAVLLTSPSTVAALSGIALASTVVVGAIGATTARAADEAGLSVSFTATAPTDRALIQGLVAHAATHALRRK